MCSVLVIIIRTSPTAGNSHNLHFALMLGNSLITPWGQSVHLVWRVNLGCAPGPGVKQVYLLLLNQRTQTLL